MLANIVKEITQRSNQVVFVKHYEGSGILSYIQANSLDSYSLTDVGRRHKTLGSETMVVGRESAFGPVS